MQLIANYNFWNAALKREKYPYHDSEVHLGYFMTSRGQQKGEPKVPVCFYMNGDELCCLRDITQVRDNFEEEFSWAAKNAITYEKSKSWYDNNCSWEEEIATIGHNSGTLTPLEQINIDIESLQQRMKNAATKDALGDCKAIATRLKNRIEEMRKDEKKPILIAGKNIDSKFEDLAAPVIALEKDSAEKLTAILKKEQEAERQRVAREREEREEQARLEALSSPQAKPVAIEEPKEVKITAGGNFGNKISLRKVEVFNVTDVGELFAHYQNQIKFITHPLVLEALGKLALADLKANIAVNGANLTTEERV